MAARRRPVASSAPQFIGTKPLDDERNDRVGDRLARVPVIGHRIPGTNLRRRSAPIKVRHSLIGPILKRWIENEYLGLGVRHQKIFAGPPTVPKYPNLVFPREASDRTFPDNEPRPAHFDLQVGKSRSDTLYLFLGEQTLTHPIRNRCGGE